MLLPYMQEGRIEAGCDEAGRGCLAGAVFAAAVVLPPDFKSEELNDSKQLSERKRYALRPLIEREALAWAVGVVTPEEIDRINILNASFLAMHRAVDQLKIRPAHATPPHTAQALPSSQLGTIISPVSEKFFPN